MSEARQAIIFFILLFIMGAITAQVLKPCRCYCPAVKETAAHD